MNILADILPLSASLARPLALPLALPLVKWTASGDERQCAQCKHEPQSLLVFVSLQGKPFLTSRARRAKGATETEPARPHLFMGFGYHFRLFFQLRLQVNGQADEKTNLKHKNLNHRNGSRTHLSVFNGPRG